MAEPGDYKFRESWWRRIENDPEVTEGLLAAALAISTEARRDGTRALMSRRRLSKFLGVSEATATRRTQKLLSLGYLELVERGGRRSASVVAANVYELSLPLGATPAGPPDDPWGDSQSDTWVSPWAEPQQVTQMTRREPIPTAHPDDPLGETPTAHLVRRV